jgi:hypothetical protein
MNGDSFSVICVEFQPEVLFYLLVTSHIIAPYGLEVYRCVLLLLHICVYSYITRKKQKFEALVCDFMCISMFTVSAVL